MRTPTTTLFKAVKLKKPNGKRAWMIQRRSLGRRERIYFENEKEARREANDRNRKIEAHGTTVNLTAEQQIYAQACVADLAAIGKPFGMQPIITSPLSAVRPRRPAIFSPIRFFPNTFAG
jgi:hypothetical protein